MLSCAYPGSYPPVRTHNYAPSPKSVLKEALESKKSLLLSVIIHEHRLISLLFFAQRLSAELPIKIFV